MTRPKRLPTVLTDEERRALLKQPNSRSPTGMRNYCIMRLMLDAGLRVSEALSLRTNDINWNTGELVVRQGKGNKDRVLWVNGSTLEWLLKWFETRPVQTELLFTTLKGTPLLDSYIRHLMRRLSRKAGISKPIHPHTLRHTFATDLYRNTKNIRLVQKALGHADLSTTMIYTHIVDEELEKAMKSFRDS